MKFKLEPATANDVAALATLHTAVADHLTETHGRGPWSSKTTETGVHYALRKLARIRGTNRRRNHRDAPDGDQEAVGD
jgi:hypothetical protein